MRPRSAASGVIVGWPTLAGRHHSVVRLDQARGEPSGRPILLVGGAIHNIFVSAHKAEDAGALSSSSAQAFLVFAPIVPKTYATLSGGSKLETGDRGEPFRTQHHDFDPKGIIPEAQRASSKGPATPVCRYSHGRYSPSSLMLPHRLSRDDRRTIPSASQPWLARVVSTPIGRSPRCSLQDALLFAANAGDKDQLSDSSKHRRTQQSVHAQA
jgi:hypothetical protein